MSDDPAKTRLLPDGPAGELPVGAELSQGMYRVTGRIAAGGFGITYEARDNLDRKVAIKECFPAGLALRAGDFTVSAASASTAEPFETARILFLREARTLAVLRHPNIVHVQTLFEENGTAYMAMDYIDGRDLQHVIEHTPEELTPTYIMELTRALLGAMHYLHRDAPATENWAGKERLLHRDIKPANIRIDPLGTPVVIDFGAARQETKNRSRAAGTFRVVSDGYSPNEFYVAGNEQGPASDLYSVAATLHHCIAGAAPVPADERAQKVSNGEDDPYVPLAGRFPGHDPRLLALIDRALSRPLKDRPVDAAAWFAAIPDSTTRIVTPIAAVAPAPAPAANGGFWTGAAVGGVALALLGGGALAMSTVFGIGPASGPPGTEADLARALDAATTEMGTLEAELATMTETSNALQADVAAAAVARDLAQARAEELDQTVDALRQQLAAAADGDDPQTTVLRNQLNQAIADQEGTFDVQQSLEVRVAELEAELAAAQINAGAGAQVEMLIVERDAALARAAQVEADLATALASNPDAAEITTLREDHAAAIAASAAAQRDVDRIRADMDRMATNLSAAEAEAARLNMELRAARAEIDLILATSIQPNPGPVPTASACPSWETPGEEIRYTGTDIYSPQTLTARATGTAALSACEGLPFNVTGAVTEAPTYTFHLTEMQQFRRVEMQVVADCNTTLLVNTQDTVWHFDDDSNGGVNPLLNLTGLQAIEGRIDVWIGAVAGAECEATLEIETWLN